MAERIYKPEPIPTGKWTSFMDMHSGGGCKTAYEYIYIEAPEDRAKLIFEEQLGRDPDNVTCQCCGGDYSITEADSLEEATQYEREGFGRKHKLSVEEYIKKDTVLVIRVKE